VVLKRPLSWWPGGKKEVSKAMRYAKFMLTPAAAGAALILSSAQTARADFSGPYAPANWTLNANGGSGSAVNDGFTLTLTGNDAGFGDVMTDYSISAVASGTWSFDWLYTSSDSENFDDGGYLLNGVYTLLAINAQSGITGQVSIGVNTGDIIGFRVHSVDGAFGPGVLTITNFVAPVPAPGSLALLGLAAMSGRSRRRRC
jgi:hypothetical protein